MINLNTINNIKEIQALKIEKARINQKDNHMWK